jgi:SAM-dependent methyltransferase
MYGADWFTRTIDGIFDSVRTGESAFVKLYGKRGYEFLKEHPEQANLAHRAMESYTERFEKPLLDRYDLSWASVIVDVGGGSGAFLAQVLGRTPQARGILAERPEVAEQARQLLRERGVAERCEVAAIDMFESVPKGGDAYVIKRVIHNWSDEQATRLLVNCREAMRPDGRVLVIEAVIPSEGAGLFGKLGDLQQLALGAGRGRTDHEFRRLCEAAGLRVANVLPYGEHVTIIEAVAG